MLAMVVNDDEGRLKESGATTTIASMLAPTGGSHPTVFRHRQRVAITNDEMVEHPHIDEV